MTQPLSKEERILRMIKRVLTDIARDTSTPPGMKHPLSEHTIQGMRECLGLISAREREIIKEAGRTNTARPEFVDEPKTTPGMAEVDRVGNTRSKTQVISFHKPGKKPDSDTSH